MLRASLTFLVLASAGCVPPTNPFDPDAPAALQARASVSGTISDAIGPVGGAVVELGDATQDARPDGSYAFVDVTPGVMTLTVDHPTHARFERDLIVSAGDDRTVDPPCATARCWRSGCGKRAHPSVWSSWRA